MIELLSQSQDKLYERMRQLTDFRNNFEDHLEMIDTTGQSDEDIDTLI